MRSTVGWFDDEPHDDEEPPEAEPGILAICFMWVVSTLILPWAVPVSEALGNAVRGRSKR